MNSNLKHIYRTEKIPPYKVTGISYSGDETFFLIPELKFGIDAGLHAPDIYYRIKYIFISHQHPDHWAGLIHLLFFFYLNKKTLTVIVPDFHFKEWSIFIEHLKNFSHIDFPVILEILSIQHPFKLNPTTSITGYQMHHKYLSMGIIVSYNQRPILGFTSDTNFDGLINNPDFFLVPNLFIESSFMNPADVQKARDHFHIHLQDIKMNLQLFHNEKIILTHYRKSDGFIKNWINYYFTNEEKKRFQVW